MKGFIRMYDQGGAPLRILPSRKRGASVKSASVEVNLGTADLLRLQVESLLPIDWQIGERAVVYGRSYRLNRLPSMKKSGDKLYSYQLEYEGRQYDLLRVLFDLTVDTTQDKAQDLMQVALTGTAYRFLEVLTSNARRVYGSESWQMGQVPTDTETKTLSFGETDNCLSTLQRICKEWKLEYRLREEGQTVYIDLKPEGEGERLPGTYAVGRGKGLYSLERATQDATSIVTRLKVYGSNENLPHRYRAHRLCLPEKSKALSYIEDTEATERLGLWEATKVFEEIKPERTGTLSRVNAKNPLIVEDEAMFDLGARNPETQSTLYLIAGQTAKLHFITGQLAGYDFEVAHYDHANHAFTLNPHEVRIGADVRTLPNETLRFQRGDKYKLIDIALPPEYAKSAEEELQRQGAEYLKQNAQPRLRYTLTLSERSLYLMEHKGGATRDIFTVGDYVHIVDQDMGVDKHVRITAITRDALNPYDYKLTLGEAVEYTLFQKMISQKLETEQVVKTLEVKSRERAERAHKQAEELREMVFDPEGNYYSEKIKPQSIETRHISVGARPDQIFVSGLLIEANKGGQASKVSNTEGQITHLSIEDKPRGWTIAGGTSSLDHDDRPYYIYIEAPKEGDEALVFYSTEALKVDAREGKYIFQIGVLHTPIDGVRGVTLTYGSTMINGRFITTGQIKSADGQTYFDLDTGTIGGNILLKDGKPIDDKIMEEMKKLTDEDYLRKVIKDGSTTIQGGLVSTGLIGVKNAEGKITGYMSGDASRSSFIVAGSKGLEDSLPSIDIKHNGNARFGQLHIEGDSGVVRAKETPESPAYLTIGGEMPHLIDIIQNTPKDLFIQAMGTLVEGTRQGVWHPSESRWEGTHKRLLYSTDECYYFDLPLTPLFRTTSAGTLHIPALSLTAVLHTTHKGRVENVTYMLPCLYLEEENDTEFGLRRIVLHGSGEEISQTTIKRQGERIANREYRPSPREGMAPPTNEGRVSISLPLQAVRGFGGGRYRMVLRIFFTHERPYSGSLKAGVHLQDSPVSLHYRETEGKSDQAIFAKDGVSISLGTDKLLYLSKKREEAFATIRGVTDFPGLLLSGRVSASGRLEYVWGARRLYVSTEKLQRGIYKVTHNLGHTNYTVMLAGENRHQDKAGYQNLKADSFEVWMTNGSNDHFDYGFCFSIIGDNSADVL